jgi:tRNA threonylcarbamoyladenosine biosynthesis protein TsaB
VSGLPILSIDTTSEHGSLALAESDRLCAEVALHSPDGFGHVLFGEIEKFLAAHGAALADIGLFAAASGPGSFTGVRVGLAAAKGLAASLGKPAAGISNLEALAQKATGDLVAAVIDARRGEVYAALFDANRRLTGPEVVTSFDEWKRTIPENATWIHGGPDQLLAGAVAALAWRRYQREGPEGLDPALVDANYVRKSDAELFWVDR